MVLKTYDRLSKSAAQGWGKGFYDEEIARKIRENLLQFSGAKTNRMLEQIAGIREQGLSKEEFLQEAKKISERQNGQYLDVEATYSARSAQSAKDWQRFVKEKNILPNLTFRTMQDSNVRPDHSKLEGMTKSVDAAEWSKYTPPLDPGCRCWLEQTIEPETSGTPNEETNPQYGGNVGKTGKPFTNEHSYFQMPKETRQAIRLNTEAMKEHLPYNRIIELANEKKVFVNDFADLSDLEENISAAKKIATELKTDVYIRPHINIDNYKNPELGIGRTHIKGDLKTLAEGVNTENFIKNSLKSANKQGCKYAVLDITASEKDSINRLKRKLYGELNKSHKNIENVVIIKGGKAITITRKQITKLDFTPLETL